MNKIRFRKLMEGSVFLLTAAALLLLSAKRPDLASFYARNIYPLFVNTIGRICSLVPFSAVEIGVYILAALIVLTFGYSLIRMVLLVCRNRKKEGEKPLKALSPLLSWLSGTYLLIGVLVLVYTLTCGIQYHASSFSQLADYEIVPAAEEELKGTCEMLIAQLNELTDEISYDSSGCSILPAGADQEARICMENLGLQYSFMSGYYPRPKGLLISEILSYQFLMGVYSPFTVEANYNADMPGYDIPATMCHELSHLKGFMREDEAGFISYLACCQSEDPMFRYSGAMLAFTYCMNSYYNAAGADAYFELYDTLDSRVIQDRRNNSAWWEQFRGPAAEKANQVNDAYLKANHQTDGVKSYGRMTDLMIAFWRKQNPEN